MLVEYEGHLQSVGIDRNAAGLERIRSASNL